MKSVLYRGPCLNAELYSLLLKFRICPIATTADIGKVYLQISIDVLWYSDLSEEIISEYRFT